MSNSKFFFTYPLEQVVVIMLHKMFAYLWLTALILLSWCSNALSLSAHRHKWNIVRPHIPESSWTSSGEIQQVLATAGDELFLQCSLKNLTLHILEAYFGQDSTVTGSISREMRESVPQALPIVQNLCERKQSCKLHVTPAFFQTGSSIGDTGSFWLRYLCQENALVYHKLNNLRVAPMSTGSWNLQYNPGIHEVDKGALAVADKTRLSRSFVTLRDLSATCPLVLPSEGVASLDLAKQKCAALPSCNFVIYTPTSVTLCGATAYESPRNTKGSLVAIKGTAVDTDGYKVHPDYQGVCSRDMSTGEVAGIQTTQEAAILCDKNPSCDFFTLSTTHGIQGATKSFRNHLWMCKGNPSMVPHEGFIFGSKLRRYTKNTSSLYRCIAYALSNEGPRKYDNLVLYPGLQGFNGPLPPL